MTPLLHNLYGFILTNDQVSKEVDFADHLIVARYIKEVKLQWELLLKVGLKYGCYPKLSKSYIQNLDSEQNLYSNKVKSKLRKSVNDTLEYAIESKEFKWEYFKSMVKDCNDQLISLWKIAKMEQPAAHPAFIGGLKGNFMYFLWTIPDIYDFIQPIGCPRANKFMPAISGGHIVKCVECKLISPPMTYGGLVIPRIKDIAKLEYAKSRCIKKELAPPINNQDLPYNVDTSSIEKIKKNNEKSKRVL